MGDAQVHPVDVDEPIKVNGHSVIELESEDNDKDNKSFGESKPTSAKQDSTADEDEIPDHECDDLCKEKFPVHWAAKEFEVEAFKNLLKTTQDDLATLDCSGATILILIVSREDAEWKDAMEEIVEQFLKYVTAQGKLDSSDKISEFVNVQKIKGERKTALHYVAGIVNQSLVELLLSYGADASIQDSSGNVPLHCIAQTMDCDPKVACAITEMLIDSMPNKDVLNDLGKSVLEEAVYYGLYEDMIQLLMDKGCSPRPVKINKETGEETRTLILHVGVHYVYDEDDTNMACFKTFLKNLSAEDVNAKYTEDGEAIWKGRTALHVAAYNLFPNVLQCLLDHEDIDILAVDDDGRSALHIIADFGYNTKTSEFVEILLGSKKLKKSDRLRLFNMTDASGETALDITIRRDSTALSRAILLQNPKYPDEWMTRDLFEKIYYKVPEIMLPIMDQYINFDNKNYEANDELFEAVIGPVTFFDNNTCETGYPAKLTRETDFLAVMLDSSFVKWDEMETVMAHPVVGLFILEKWKKLRVLFWFEMILKVLWLVAYLLFVIDVFWFTFPFPEAPNATNTTQSTPEEPMPNPKSLQTSQFVIGICIVVSTIVIFYANNILSIIAVGFRKTITPVFIAHLIFSCIVCIIIITLSIWGVQEWHYMAVSASIVLVSFIGMWEGRDIPVIGIYADVFFTAIKNLTRLMIAFAPLLIGFSIAISLMLRGNKSFSELHWNFIKILVMMLGEINFSDIFNTSDNVVPFRAFTILIVALFVISVPIVMFNLLLGFTISDVQALEADSEMKVLISTLEQIILLERLVLCLPAQKLIPQTILWRFLVERKDWTPECIRFGRKCSLKLLMADIPRKIRIKIREIARTRPVKKPNQSQPS